MNKVLVIAPHPDDEVLGCGGTLLKHISKGDEVHWLIVTNIDVDNGWDPQEVDGRQEEIFAVASKFAFAKTHKMDFPTTKLDSIPMGEIISAVSGVVNEVQPNVIYLPNKGDVHTDHHISFQVGYSCTKNFRYPSVKKVLVYETLSETEVAPAIPGSSFLPNHFVDITGYLDKKLEIMKIYENQLMDPPYPRSLEMIEVLAKYRGSRIGCDYAEAFMMIHETA